MKKEFLPYYVSRILLSLILSAVIFGLSWKAGIFALVLIGFFLLYLHSGWFQINLDTPLTPLRRDGRGKEIQRKALIAALFSGIVTFVISPYFCNYFSTPNAGYLSLSLGILVYFGVQFSLLSRS